MAELHNAITERDSITHDQVDGLEYRCRAVKSDLVQWRIDCHPYMMTTIPPQGVPAMQGDIRAEMLSASCALQAAACRCVSAVSRAERVAEEEEAVSLAYYLRKVYTTAKYDRIARFYFKQRMGLSESILSSTKVWLQGCPKVNSAAETCSRDCSPSERLVEDDKFQAWLDFLPTDEGE